MSKSEGKELKPVKCVLCGRTLPCDKEYIVTGFTGRSVCRHCIVMAAAALQLPLLGKPRKASDKTRAATALLPHGTPLRALLFKETSDDAAAARLISARILFSLERSYIYSLSELAAMQKWLEAAVYYFLTECSEDEQTFASLMTVCEKEDWLLAYMCGRVEDKALRRPATLTKECLEQVILDLDLRKLLGNTMAAK